MTKIITKTVMSKIATVGLDLAKNTVKNTVKKFQLNRSVKREKRSILD